MRINAVKIKVKFRDSLCVASKLTYVYAFICGLHLGVWCNNKRRKVYFWTNRKTWKTNLFLGR